MDSFKEGMIVRIFCQDFLTYNSIECFPCAKLNMIVGPNGTGKSSLVNAIVLGLGGKITVIGRAKQLAAYVRRGCDTAKIEIELYSEPENYVIGRKFTIENKSTWTINGETVSLKHVETVIHQLNIQVDNLCQFLPQDRVQDFAKMDSKQLLENTLKTVGSTEIVELHDSLKELRGKQTNLASHTDSMKKKLDSEKMKVERLEVEVKAIKEREEILSSVKMVEKKKAWMEFAEKEKRKKAVLKDREKIMVVKAEAERNVIPYENDIRKTKEEIKNMNKRIHREMEACGEHSTKVRRGLEVAANVDDRIASVQSDLDREMEKGRRRADKISALQEEIFKLESFINPAKENQLTQQIKEMHYTLNTKSNEVSNAQGTAQEIEDQMAEIARKKSRLEGTLEREMSAVNKKLQVLEYKYRDAHRAYLWLEQNRAQFRSKVYGPIMLEINCGEDVAKFVEFSVHNKDLIAFVCENKDDMNLMLRTVRDQMGMRINVVQATANCHKPVSENWRPAIPIDRIKQFGFWTYMIDQVEGPNPVLNYLCQNYGLHQIPLGNRQTNNLADKIPDSIRSYFSDTHNFTVRVSRYSGEKSSRIVNVPPSKLLAGSTNTADIAEYKQLIQIETSKLTQMRTELDNVKSQIVLIERQRDDLRSQKRTMDQELLTLTTGRSKLKMRKEELEEITTQDLFDPDAEKAKVKVEITKLVIDVCAQQKNIVGFVKNYQNGLCKNSLNRLKQSIAEKVLRKKQEASVEATQKVEECKTMLLNVEEDLRNVQREFKRAQEQALKLTEDLSPKDSEFKRKYDRPFAALPTDMDALDEEISKLTARADCLAGGRLLVLEEYENTKKLIRDLEKAVANPELKLQALREEMDEKRGRWLPQVLDLISRINNNFFKFFELMKCVGEVSIEEPEDKDEYSKYGICIKVQFRETGKLQQLGPHTQSGGERAVSTAIYMLSLQELTTVPFRCVDEINQGMDEYNERVVFKLMVRTVEKANSAQCFLLTPKILRSLDYSENVQVLCIYSGISSVSHKDFKVNKFMDEIKQSSQRIKRESLKRKHTDSEDSD